MFLIGHAHDVNFNVNVMGTSAEPTVRLVLGCSPELSFPARKVAAGWVSTVNVPVGFSPCECDLRVEVMVNNRLFTPLVKRVELQVQDAPAEPAPQEPAEPVQADPAPREEPTVEPAEVPAQTASSGGEISFTTKVKENAGLSLLRSMAQAEPKKAYAPVHTPLPKPSDVKVQPIKVSIADIMKVAEEHETTKPLPVTKKTVVPVVEIKHETPTRLVKGAIIYE